MQLIKDGPDIPNEVLQHQEEGKLIFSCGAGVSYPADLPNFKGLAERIYDHLNEERQPEEQQALDVGGQYDRTLGLLENRLVDPSLVRKAVIQILQIDPTKTKKLETHEALLTLAQSREGSYRRLW